MQFLALCPGFKHEAHRIGSRQEAALWLRPKHLKHLSLKVLGSSVYGEVDARGVERGARREVADGWRCGRGKESLLVRVSGRIRWPGRWGGRRSGVAASPPFMVHFSL